MSHVADAMSLRVAVVGSGPAGLYAAEALIKQTDGAAQVDVLDRLPTPYGLVRYGVAPDHKSIKAIARYLQKVLEHPSVRFFGGVELGRDVTREDLLACYDAVIYSTGAMVDRHLGIPGEDLPGSIAATDFVNWYCGHPDAADHDFDLSVEEVAVIGVGNVAVDVVRILAKTAGELRDTDIPENVIEALSASKVRTIHLIGRRGPAQAKFTTKEARELGELGNATIHIRPADMDLDAASAAEAEADRHIRGNLKAMHPWTAEPAEERPRHIDLRFWLAPVEIIGIGRVEGLRLERTTLSEAGRVLGTGEYETLPVGMVLRSVGYQTSADPAGSSAPTSPTPPRPSPRFWPTCPGGPPNPDRGSRRSWRRAACLSSPTRTGSTWTPPRSRSRPSSTGASGSSWAAGRTCWTPPGPEPNDAFRIP